MENGDQPSRGLYNQAFEYAIARKRDDVARIEGEHPLVTLEAGTGAQPHVERERDLRDAATFSPARCQTVDAPGVAAMDEHHVREAVADLVEGGPDIVAAGQRIVFESMTGAPTGAPHRGSLGHRTTTT